MPVVTRPPVATPGPVETGRGPDDTGRGPDDTGRGPDVTGVGPLVTGVGPLVTGVGFVMTGLGPLVVWANAPALKVVAASATAVAIKLRFMGFISCRGGTPRNREALPKRTGLGLPTLTRTAPPCHQIHGA
jgi:hypothetical protein